jgi:hypothetical protein
MFSLKYLYTTSGTLAVAVSSAKDYCNDKGLVNVCLV